MRWLLSEDGKQAYDLLDDAAGWDFDEYEIVHRATGLALWVANGISFLNGRKSHRPRWVTAADYRPLPPFELAIRDKAVLWRKVQRARAINRNVRRLAGS